MSIIVQTVALLQCKRVLICEHLCENKNHALIVIRTQICV